MAVIAAEIGEAMTTHTITADVEVKFVPAGLTDTEVEYPVLDIEFTYLPGAGPTGPTYSSGGDPGYPAEVDFVSAKMIDGKGLLPTQEQINDWARDYLNDDAGYRHACREATSR